MTAFGVPNKKPGIAASFFCPLWLTKDGRRCRHKLPANPPGSQPPVLPETAGCSSYVQGGRDTQSRVIMISTQP